MSQCFHSKNAFRFLLRLIAVVGAAFAAPVSLAQGLAGEDAYARWNRASREASDKILTDIRNGGDPHEAALSSNHWESFARDFGDAAKADAASKGVQLAAAVMSNRDPQVDLSRFPGTMPPFDYAKYGLKPFFAQKDPRGLVDGIRDPVAREAYREAAINHMKILERWFSNDKMQREADYCINRVRDAIAAATDKAAVAKAVLDAVDTLKDAAWIKDYLRAKLAPALPAPLPAARGDSSLQPPASQSEKKSAISPPAAAAKGEAPQKRTPPAASASAPVQEPNGDKSVLMVAGIVAAALGLVGVIWVFVVRRRNQPGDQKDHSK